MGDSLTIFIEQYCEKTDSDYIKLSRFKKLYYEFCNDNNLKRVEITENELFWHNLETIYLRNSLWLKGLLVK